MEPIKNPTTVDVPQLSPERRLLWEAARLIEERGHARGALVTSDGRMCALGALNCAATGDPRDTLKRSNVPGYAKAFNAIRARAGGSIVSWNNAPERTASEVIQALRDAAVS